MLDTHELQRIAAAQQPRGGEAAATQLVASIRRAADTMESLLTVDFSAFQLNQARFAALQFIGQSSSQGCSQTELAAGLGQSESSVSGLVSRMRADGLLYRLRTKHDQRKRLLMLSARGRQLLTDCELSFDRQTANIFSRFDSDWLERLSGLLDVFVQRLAQIEGANEVENANEEVEQQIHHEDLIRRSA